MLDDRARYVRSLFDDTAYRYESTNTIFSLGLGQWYRRRALRRGGLQPGMRLLDVAIGTGLIARAALSITGNVLNVIGLDVSASMLGEAKAVLPSPLIQANAELLPIADASIDFVSMGYALRHVSDLAGTFNEFRRVLRPGGTLLLLEFVRPAERWRYWLAAWYLGRVVPSVCRLLWPRARSATLMRYLWQTIDHSLSPQVILDHLRGSGFTEASCETELDLFCVYRAKRPD
jgi:demethylmenaquinone methyltransferase/2-methoxy-6-polyprenyl-1,4-benzoquinol methylase